MKVLFLLVGVICTVNMLILFILLEHVRELRNEHVPALQPPKSFASQRENDEYSLFFDLGDISRNMRKRFKISGKSHQK